MRIESSSQRATERISLAFSTFERVWEDLEAGMEYPDLRVFECPVIVSKLELNSIAHTDFGECKVKTKIAK